MRAISSTRAGTGAHRAVGLGSSLALGLVALAGGIGLYAGTIAPTVLWGDDAELQRIVVTGEPRVIGQSSGASHLLWLGLASRFVRATRWLPLDPAGRSALVTALLGGASLAFVAQAGAALARRPAGRPMLAGAGAATALGLSHTFWLLAVRPDAYTLQTALLAAGTWCLLRWRETSSQFTVHSSPSLASRGWPFIWLLAAVGAVVAALANHAMILASLPGLAALTLAVPMTRRRPVLFVIAAAAVAAIAALLVGAATGAPAGALVQTLGNFRPVLPGGRDLLSVPLYLLYQFPVSLLFAVPGVRALWRRDRGALLGLALLYAGNVALPLLIRVHDRFQFFLPSYLPVALVIGVGASTPKSEVPSEVRSPKSEVDARHRISDFGLRTGLLVASLVAPLPVYPLAAIAGGALAARLAPARTLPDRDPVVFYLWPPKGAYTGARRFGEAALDGMAPQATIVADWLPYQTLRYLQTVEGRRSDVQLANVNAGGEAQLRFLLAQDAQRPLYLADDSPYPYYEMTEIERCFAVQREGVVYRLTRRPGATAGCS